jgi:ABC-type transport system involved in multi-copper enzyme maturation permease subunit
VQFLAFLQDSYREAKSGWMLHVMLALAGLLVLLVLSIGFRPVTLQDELVDHLSLLTRVAATNPETGKPRLGIENVTSSNPDEPWKADYAFDYVVTTDSPDDMKKAVNSGMPVARKEAERFLGDALRFLKNVEVTGGSPEVEELKKRAGPKDKEADAKDKGDAGKETRPLPAEIRYRVTTKGTKVDDRLAWRHRVSVLFAYEIPYFYTSLREGVYVMEKYLVNGAGAWVLLFVAVIITAGFIPSMLAKGSLDLMVSKPIGRTRLLVYKYVGGLTFVLILTTATVTGVWLAIGVRSGIWTPNFLAIIPILTFYFAVLYAVSTTVAVFTRNTLVAILLTGVAWAALWVVGKVNDGIENRGEQLAKVKADAGTPEAVLREVEADQPLWGFIPKSVFPFVTALHVVTPRTYQLDDRLGRLIAEGVLTPNELKARDYDTPPRVSWAEMVLVSLVGIAALLAVAAWRFSSRDY